jgi:hypothetical protein
MSIRALVEIDLEGQQAERPDGRADLLVVHERRRAAELAVLAHPLGFEHHHSPAALALHAAARGLPAALAVRQIAERGRGSSSTAWPVRRSMTAGDSVPQKGQMSFWRPACHSACAPQAGQECFSIAETSAAMGRGGSAAPRRGPRGA